MQLSLLRETLAGVHTAAETALALQGLGSYPILLSGSPATVERWLPGVVTGDMVAAFALSEPGAGSDAAALSPEPRRRLARADTRRRGWRLHRREDVDLQRPGGRRLHRLRPHHPGRPRAGRDRVRGARRRRGSRRRAPRPARPARHRPADLRRGARRAGRRARRGRRGLRRGHAHARPVPPQRRRVRGRHGAGGPGRRRHLVDRAAGARRRAQRAAVGRAHPRRDGHARAGRPAAGPGGRLVVRRGGRTSARSPRRPRWPSCSPPRRRSGSSTRPSSCTVPGGSQRGHLLEHLYREVRAPRIYEGASEVQRTIIGRSLVRAQVDREGER